MKYEKSWFHCRSETYHTVRENFSFAKRIVRLQRVQLVAFSETERFRIFLQCTNAPEEEGKLAGL